MKLWTLLLLVPVFALCACGTSTHITPSHTEISESIAMEPITPTDTITHEDWIENITNALSSIQPLYEEMLSSASKKNTPQKAVKKAAEVEKKYGKRIKEIAAISLTDLSDEELKAISFELSDIMSAIRDVNDLLL